MMFMTWCLLVLTGSLSDKNEGVVVMPMWSSAISMNSPTWIQLTILRGTGAPMERTDGGSLVSCSLLSLVSCDGGYMVQQTLVRNNPQNWIKDTNKIAK